MNTLPTTSLSSSGKKSDHNNSTSGFQKGNAENNSKDLVQRMEKLDINKQHDQSSNMQSRVSSMHSLSSSSTHQPNFDPNSRSSSQGSKLRLGDVIDKIFHDAFK